MGTETEGPRGPTSAYRVLHRSKMSNGAGRGQCPPGPAHLDDHEHQLALQQEEEALADAVGSVASLGRPGGTHIGLVQVPQLPCPT